MIADDHAGFRRLVKTLLKDMKADVVECENGSEAVAQYPVFQPDVVLMDIAMKVLDGLKATAQLTARFPGARIFIVTQYDDPDLRTAAQEAGACGYVLKHDLDRLPTLLCATPPRHDLNS